MAARIFSKLNNQSSLKIAISISGLSAGKTLLANFSIYIVNANSGDRLVETDAPEMESGRGSAEYVNELKGCRTSYDVFRVLKDVCKEYGYCSFIVLHLPVHADTSLNNQILITNWNPELIRAYDALGLADGSPIISRVRQSPFAFFLRYRGGQRRPH